MAKWTGKKVKVAFTKPEEPSFLKDFKRRAGYKEGTTVTDKFSEMPDATAEDLADNEEDLPQIVTIGRGALSEAECEALEQEGRLQTLLQTGAAANDEGPSDGKIVFRKPGQKRELSEDTVEDRETAALKEKDKKRQKKKKKQEDLKKKLLSFDDDIDDE